MRRVYTFKYKPPRGGGVWVPTMKKELTFWISFFVWLVLGVLGYVFPPMVWLQSPPWVCFFAWCFMGLEAGIMRIVVSIHRGKGSSRSRKEFLTSVGMGLVWSQELGVSSWLGASHGFPLAGMESFSLLATMVIEALTIWYTYRRKVYSSPPRQDRWWRLWCILASFLAWIALGVGAQGDTRGPPVSTLAALISLVLLRSLRLVMMKRLMVKWGTLSLGGLLAVCVGGVLGQLPWAVFASIQGGALGAGDPVWRSIPEGALVSLFFWSQLGLVWHLVSPSTYVALGIARDLVRHRMSVGWDGWLPWTASTVFFLGPILWVTRTWLAPTVPRERIDPSSGGTFLSEMDSRSIETLSELMGPLEQSSLHIIPDVAPSPPFKEHEV